MAHNKPITNLSEVGIRIFIRHFIQGPNLEKNIEGLSGGEKLDKFLFFGLNEITLNGFCFKI